MPLPGRNAARIAETKPLLNTLAGWERPSPAVVPERNTRTAAPKALLDQAGRHNSPPEIAAAFLDDPAALRNSVRRLQGQLPNVAATARQVFERAAAML
jgi:hypothetical protein